jgi:hypothetical protein
LTVTLATGFTPTIGSTFTVLTAASVTGTFSNSTIGINGTEHFNVSYTSTGVVLTVAAGAAPQSGLGQPSLAAAVPRKQPVLTSGMRHWIGAMPRGSSHILAGTGNFRAHSGAIFAGGSGLKRYEASNRLPVQVAARWEHMPSRGLPAAQLERSPGRVSQNVPQSNNWNSSARGVSSLRMPVTATPVPRMPVKILPPMLPRLGR